MVTLNQIRAARGLLNWTQKDLAAAIGLSVIAMNNIDRGQTEPRRTTLEKIQNIFESHGVEFTDGQGVRLRDEVFKVDVYQGRDGIIRYYKDIIDTLRRQGGMALHITYDETFFWSSEHDRKALFRYYKEFLQYGLQEQLLLSDAANRRYGPEATSEYRVYDRDMITQVNTSVYGTKYAILLPNRIITIENPEIAETYRRQFLDCWSRGKPLPPTRPVFDDDLAESLKRR